MCDYSLFDVPNRLARQADELILHRFLNGSIGLTEVAAKPLPPGPVARRSWWRSLASWMATYHVDPCAVCISPGTRLQVSELNTALQARYHVNAEEEVTFTQITAEAYRHRDAIRFNTGQEVLLQDLPVGLNVRVLSLGGAEETELVPVTLRQIAR